MKQSGFKFLFAAILATALVGSPFFLKQADPRGFGGGFGGFHGSRGFGGGSFRDGGFAEGPRGDEAARGQEGNYAGGRGGTYQGYHDVNYNGEGNYVGGRGGTYQGPHDWNHNGGNVNINNNVNVNGGWGAYYGPGWGEVAAGAAAGVATGLAIGASVAYLPPAATPIVVSNQTYYVVGNTYYQPCFIGAETSYCVVASPY